MKTKNFILIVKSLGYGVEVVGNTISIYSIFNDGTKNGKIAEVRKDYVRTLNTDFEYVPDMVLFSIMNEYSSTPIAER